MRGHPGLVQPGPWVCGQVGPHVLRTGDPGATWGAVRCASKEQAPAVPGRVGTIWEHPSCGQTPRQGAWQCESQRSFN